MFPLQKVHFAIANLFNNTHNSQPKVARQALQGLPRPQEPQVLPRGRALGTPQGTPKLAEIQTTPTSYPKLARPKNYQIP